MLMSSSSTKYCHNCAIIVEIELHEQWNLICHNDKKALPMPLPLPLPLPMTIECPKNVATHGLGAAAGTATVRNEN